MSDEQVPGPEAWLGTPEDRREPGEVEAATLADIARAPSAAASDKARAVKLARLLDASQPGDSGSAAVARQHQLTMDLIKPAMAAPVADPVDEIAAARAARRAAEGIA